MVVSAVAVPAALLFIIRGDVGHVPVEVQAAPVVDQINPSPDETAALCCTEFVAVAPMGFAGGNLTYVADQNASASRGLRTVERTLPAGVAPERGLQVRTILTARSISAVFPEIQQIGGVRSDALRWHPNGLALDVMIDNPSSAAGIELGNQIVAYVLKHADRFGIQDAIWRGVYYTPTGAQRGGYGHYDHVHITTTGGGYPSGSEVYYR